MQTCACGAKAFVLNSRVKPEGVYRRRQCTRCRARFSTMEVSLEIYEQLDAERRTAQEALAQATQTKAQHDARAASRLKRIRRDAQALVDEIEKMVKK